MADYALHYGNATVAQFARSLQITVALHSTATGSSACDVLGCLRCRYNGATSFHSEVHLSQAVSLADNPSLVPTLPYIQYPALTG